MKLNPKQLAASAALLGVLASAAACVGCRPCYHAAGPHAAQGELSLG